MLKLLFLLGLFSLLWNSQPSSPQQLQEYHLQSGHTVITSPLNLQNQKKSPAIYHFYGHSGYVDTSSLKLLQWEYNEFYTNPDWKYQKLSDKVFLSLSWNAQAIGDIWQQYYFGTVMYTWGWLLFSPYKFLVDAQTFSFVPQNTWFMSDPTLSLRKNQYYERDKGFPFFQNGGKQYVYYLWSDKNWIYRRSSSSRPDEVIVRERKKPDFKLLPFEEIKTYVSSGEPWDLKSYTWEIENRGQLLIAGEFLDPKISYYNNSIYIRYRYGNAVFPVDGQTLQLEVNEKTWDGTYGDTYYVLSDKDYYYQLIWHYNGSYYTLNRIKK